MPEVVPEQIVIVGETPVPQTGGEDVVEAVVEETPPEDPSNGPGFEAQCQTGQTGQSGLEVFTTEDYCLLYPPGFTMTYPEAGAVLIHGPDYCGGCLEPNVGYLHIYVTRETEGLTANEIADQLLAQSTIESGLPERIDTVLGGEQAVEVTGIPGQRTSGLLVTVHDGQVYTLYFGPLGEEYGDAFNDMQTLYNVAIPTFTFLP